MIIKSPFGKTKLKQKTEEYKMFNLAKHIDILIFVTNRNVIWFYQLLGNMLIIVVAGKQDNLKESLTKSLYQSGEAPSIIFFCHELCCHPNNQHVTCPGVRQQTTF